MKFVLGGGIAGLIFCYYNKDYTIIDDNIGGQMKSRFPLGIRLLYKNRYNKKLLNDLGIKYKVKTAKIGYFYNNDIHRTKSKNFKSIYSSITRDSSRNKSIMSSSKNKIEYYDFDYKLFIERLSNNCNILKLKAKSIDVRKKQITLSNDMIIDYKHVVSTISLITLFEMMGKKHPLLPFKSITFALVNKFCNMKDYTYYYDIENIYYRVTKYKDNQLIIELIGNRNIREIEQIAFLNVIDMQYMKYGKIINIKKKIKIKDVTLLGRYSEWKQEIKTHDIVKKSIAFGRKKRIKKYVQ